jgi:deoxyhypusine synthase
MSTSGGFESRSLVDGLEILTTMINDKHCLKFLSLVAAITSTGLRGIIADCSKIRCLMLSLLYVEHLIMT